MTDRHDAGTGVSSQIETSIMPQANTGKLETQAWGEINARVGVWLSGTYLLHVKYWI